MIDPHQTLIVAAWAIGAYLLGSINFSIALARLLGKPDPRSAGSRNAGATNLARVAGWPAAVLVLLLDLGRAGAAIWGARAAGLAELAPALALPLMLGNLRPVFHRFRGGKGVATAVGAMLAIAPAAMLCGGGVFLVALAVTRRVSIGSIAMCLAFAAWFWIAGGTVTELATAATIAAVVLLTHRHNIVRIARGQEPKLGERRDPEPGEVAR